MKRYWKTALIILYLLMNFPQREVIANDQATIRIGVLQYIEHESLDRNYQGFVEGLSEAGYVEGQNLIINYLNASGDNANLYSMSEKLANENDYLLAIATPAAQSLVNVEKEKPILFSAVSDPLEAGLVDNLTQPLHNVSGTTDAGPITEQVALLILMVPNVSRVGLIYNSGEVNSASEAEKAKVAMEENRIQVVEATVTTTNDIAQAMTTLINSDIDAIFTVTDNTIASAINLVGDLAMEAHIPVIGGSKDMVLANGLATYGLDYYELGKQTAVMLVKIIETREDPLMPPVEAADNLELVINEANAKALGISPTSNILDQK